MQNRLQNAAQAPKSGGPDKAAAAICEKDKGAKEEKKTDSKDFANNLLVIGLVVGVCLLIVGTKF